MGDHDNLRELWSEDELDTALSRLNSAVRTDAHALARARAELMAAAGGPEQGSTMSTQTSRPKRRWVRWAAPAAAVAAVVAGLLVAQTVSFNGNPPGAVAAAAELNAAADRVGASDPPVGPGQYRYVGTHAWWMGMGAPEGKMLAVLEENLIEQWAPAEFDQEWMQRRQVTGNHKVLVGTEEEVKASGMLGGRRPGQGEKRARCGDFYAADEGREPCTREGAWQVPTPAFLASLPKDPRQLYDRLRADTEGRGPGPDEEMLVYVADVLRSGTVPAEIRANLYRVLAMVPSIEITDRAANLAGKVGVAFGIGDEEDRMEIIIDVATGQFIGERKTAGDDIDGIEPGTVISFTSVETAVVDKIGTPPTS
ncbi:CU044_5270 family protein [Actinokineospora xionganensis]|uniref:CU044_5270 family protein n=1 Tax=Actinokineospora xionganensis TaxID=2684470 RepID=A0ABR7L2K4_9PSEU|nr:CU044_5270 family protein [Actinokineospora xionganensis]MBC6446926.1 CU044_5270 family protein [Actinokineospora xionganensis]